MSDPLLTSEIREALLANGKEAEVIARADPERIFDPLPVVKLFTPDGAATWLLTEIDPHDEDRAFGLCDLGQGFPQLGYVSLGEIESVRGRLGLPVERDLYFRPTKTIKVYAAEALALGRIDT